MLVLVLFFLYVSQLNQKKMSARSRSTRLSSGSTSKRNYAEGLTSSDEDDGISRKKSKSKVQESGDDDDSEDAFVPKKKGKKNGKMHASKGKSRYAESDSGSSSEFVDEEEEEQEDDLEEDDYDDSEEEKPVRGKKSPKGKGKAAAPRTSNGSTKMQSSYDEDGNEVIVMARAPTGKRE